LTLGLKKKAINIGVLASFHISFFLIASLVRVDNVNYYLIIIFKIEKAIACGRCCAFWAARAVLPSG
jgi:type IV secretory pathway VirB3-like protein